MITSQTFRKTHPLSLASKPNNSSELSKVFAAAVINQQFCDMLLNHPQQALQNGFFGESFLLSREEQDLIVSIRASSLSDLATQVSRALQI
jgi:hypothetical protein